MGVAAAAGWMTRVPAALLRVMRVSVIIPALNEVEHIQQAIAAARGDYTPDEVEVIVVDGGSSDGTPELVPPDATLMRAEGASPRGRAAQMNRGAAASHGEVLVFCHADSRLPAGWREAVLEVLSLPGVRGGSFQLAIVPARGILRLLNRLRFGANWRIMFGDQAQFTWRAVFEQVGGFPDVPLMEDLELSRKLHRAGRLVRVPLRVTTSSRRFLERGPLRQWLLDVWLVVRYLVLGATAQEIARVYRSSREDVF
ncbi:MAG TPA: TIGR04283 family arsenosugar biosynthesis glycosyltransferase [Anaerolineae bacterium]|nr:TIGR04283 family arsenosugar biosynthesis glycosyltransferase [Anaerolineae bacterium]